MKKVIGILGLIIGIVVITLVLNSICARFPQYVLLKMGIKQSDIILEYTVQPLQKFYLYKKNIKGEKSIGIIKLTKESVDSHKWVIRDDRSQQISVLDDEKCIFLTEFSKVIDGKPIGNSLLSGYKSLDKPIESNNLDSIFEIKPTLVKIEDNILYFIIDLKEHIEDNNAVKIFVE